MRIRSVVILPIARWLAGKAHLICDGMPQYCELRIGSNGERILHIAVLIDGDDWVVANINIDQMHPDHLEARDEC